MCGSLPQKQSHFDAFGETLMKFDTFTFNSHLNKINWKAKKVDKIYTMILF